MDESRKRAASKELQLLHSRALGPVLFHGNSMLPFLRDGDELIVVPVPWDAIRPGDIVTYRLAEKFPTYRVRKKLRDGLVLKPDNWTAPVRVPREDVLGRVVERRRHGEVLRHTDPGWRAIARRVRWRDRLLGMRASLRSLARRAAMRITRPRR